MFNFTIHKKSSNSLARTATFTTPHGDIKTPVFMPVGTKGSVKTLSQEDLKELDAQIILNNTYHLYLRPGDELIKEMGKLHKWIKWDKPILTDSGGFQVFSLGRQNQSHTKNCKTKIGVKIDDNGVRFTSHINGTKHYFTPEKAIEIEHNLGADIIMAFDECAPAESSESYFKSAMERTHAWLMRCCKTHKSLLEQTPSEQRALFGIVQGGLYKKLRQESAKFINDTGLPGNAIGGLSVGESKEDMAEMVETAVPHLDENKPRYLMGVGTPEDLLEAVERGIDMFDCVHPTRISRHGAFWTLDGRKNIKNKQFEKDPTELYGGYSKSYIRHLFIEKEALAAKILTMHNLEFLLTLMKNIRKNIESDTFMEFKKEFLYRYLKS